MRVRIIATKEQLEEVGIEDIHVGRIGVKIKEYWTGYDAVYLQWFESGYYFAYEFDIPNNWLEPVQ